VAYFAASCDDIEVMTKFAESVGADYPILADPTKETARAYGVLAPDRERPSRWTFYIDVDGKILHVDKKVAPSSAGADIAARLARLGARRAG